MSQSPKVTGSNGFYNLWWEEYRIAAKVDRLKSNSDHEVRGEVVFTSHDPATAGHLRQTRLILTSTSAKNGLVKSLSERIPSEDVPWDTIVETLCVIVLNNFRMGTELLTVDGEIDVQAQDKWLIEPIVLQGQPTLIYGKGASGKSYLAQYIATVADAGLNSNGLRVEPSRVLYLDWETTPEEISSRVTRIRKGMDISGELNLKYRQMTQGFAVDIETIRQHIQEHDIDLVILDSLGAACMGEPESAEVVLRMFLALRSLNVSSICIDHTNKEGALFGSTYKYNMGRLIFECIKSQDEGSDILDFGLFNRKASNGRPMKPMGFRINFEDSNVVLSRKDVRDTELETEMTLADRIENILSSGAQAPHELADRLDKSSSHIRQELFRGKQKGKFIEVGEGKYGLPVRQEQGGDKWKSDLVI